MADIVGTAASGHPNLNLTPDEKRAYAQLFKEADPDGFGAVSGDVAVKFFEKTKLPADVLGQIWQIADTENRGFLTPSGFGVVLRLIGHAQAGRAPTPQIATQPAPLPRFDTPQAQPISAQNTGASASPVPSAPPPIRVPALTPEKVNEYSSLFEKSGAENGSLGGVVAKQIFERARLPNDVLGKIWNLSDMHGRGALDSTEFVIAMHLLASYKSNAMRGVPATMPPGLYEAANRRVPPRPTSFSRPSSGAPPASAIPPQFSGYSNARPQSPVVRQQVSTPLSAQSTGDGWVITPAEKARFDQIFAGLDKPGRGFITGDQAVGFFGNAQLPEEILAQIWDLADVNSEGQLNKDEFAVAMHLIRQQRGTKDGRGNLPSTLPPALVPPSMRRQQAPPSQPTAPAFENAPINQSRSAADDLFGLDAFAASPSAPAQIPQSTGGTEVGPFANPKSPPLPAAALSPSNTFKPFIPSSSFGQSILPQQTGASGAAQTRSLPPQSQTADDLLGDADPEVSQRLTSETSELANLSNQVGNLSTQMTEVQGQRGQAEQDLSKTSQQKREFEARLGQLRSLYEQEVKDVKALQAQLTSSRSDTKRLQQEMAMIDGTHQDLRTQHQQLYAALQTDQQENAALKEKIRLSNAEIEQMKPQLEKLKSDARQQKGLVAINRKQLSTNEAERDRLKAEASAATKELEDAKREADESSVQIEASKKEMELAREESARQLEGSRREAERVREESTRQAEAFRREAEQAREESARQAESFQREAEQAREESARQAEASRKEVEQARLPPQSASRSPPPVASPTPSMSSNPFFRTAAFSPPIASPPMAEQQTASVHHSAFDSIFGPSFSSSSPSAAPPTSFMTDSPAHSREVSEFSSSPNANLSMSSAAAADLVEPPAPPKSRQITSAALPFRTPLERGDSVSSSVRVAAPASRLSPADTPRALTPSASASSTHSGQESPDPFESATPVGTEGVAARSPTGRATPSAFSSDRQASDEELTGSAVEKVDSIPGAFPDIETPRLETPRQEVPPAAVAIGAGAATLAATTGLAAATRQQDRETSKGKGPEGQPSDESNVRNSTFDDFFGGPAHQRTPSEQVADFDSAFAGMQKGPTTNGDVTRKTEFPAIQEHDADDDSSDYSEEAPMGFDDDFNARSPPRPPKISEDTNVREDAPPAPVASAVPSYLQVSRPPYGSTPSTASSLPGIESQASPPMYNDVVPTNDASHFPLEYRGLLPSREDPTSPPVENPPGSSEDPAYGPEVARSRVASPEHTSHAEAPNRASAFDFDSAFSGMAPAQVEDDEDDEDDTFTPAQNNIPEFDPTFDSSPTQSRSTTAASNSHPYSIYSAVTNGTTQPSSQTTQPYTGFQGYSNTTSMQEPEVRDRTPVAVGNTGARGASHDWDAMFAGIDAPPAVSGNDISGPPTPQASQQQQSAATHLPAAAASPSSPLPTARAVPKRPAPGRALSQGTEHDDPILKRLTAMGWSRDESLRALEQFDYNIDKAADYLTFKS